MSMTNRRFLRKCVWIPLYNWLHQKLYGDYKASGLVFVPKRIETVRKLRAEMLLPGGIITHSCCNCDNNYHPGAAGGPEVML